VHRRPQRLPDQADHGKRNGGRDREGARDTACAAAVTAGKHRRLAPPQGLEEQVCPDPELVQRGLHEAEKVVLDRQVSHPHGLHVVGLEQRDERAEAEVVEVARDVQLKPPGPRPS
jgi:hypothetical protein